MNTQYHLELMAALLEQLGYHAGLDEQGRVQASVADLALFAKKLSALVGKSPPWGYPYMRNVLNGKLDPSALLIKALEQLAVSLDGQSPVRLNKVEVTLLAEPGTVAPNTVILIPSRACRNPVCPVSFIPKTWNQYYCCSACKAEAKRIAKESNGHH